MRLFAARNEDVQDGVVWLQSPGLPPRCVVKITNHANKKSVYCEALQMEANFLCAYNHPPRFDITNPAESLVMGGWHRALLGGLATGQDVPVSYAPCNSWCWGKIRACFDHPQTVVRVSAALGVVGLILGVLGFLAGVVPLFLNASLPRESFAHELPPADVAQVFLHASLKDGYVTGKFFNQTPDAVITHITIEAVPQDEKNPFNGAAPRFFEVAATAQPRAMSRPFVAETGPLNPEFHKLRVSAAKGVRR
jgi:hypothetical protein